MSKAAAIIYFLIYFILSANICSISFLRQILNAFSSAKFLSIFQWCGIMKIMYAMHNIESVGLPFTLILMMELSLDMDG